jgi:hypothetical protein
MDWTIVLNSLSTFGAAAAAGAAAWQAYETRKQVIESKNQGEMARKQFLQARYDDARPVLLIVSDPQGIPLQQGNGRYLDWDHQPPTIKVQNAGKGPALHVRSVIYGPEAQSVPASSPPSSGTWKHFSDEKEGHWYHWAMNAVGQGDKEALAHVLARSSGPNNFSAANMHLTAQDRTQTYSFKAPAQPLSRPGSGETWHLCRVTMTYQDIFHRKHASIHDLVYPQRWQIVALIDDIENDLDDLLERSH